MAEEPDFSHQVGRLPAYPFIEEDKWTSGMLEEFPKHALCISYLIAEWSAVENKLVKLATISVGTAAYIIEPMVYSIVSSFTRLEALQGAFAVIYQKNEPKRTDMEEVCLQAKSLLTQRNKYAHALYGRTHGGELVVIGTRGKPSEEIPLYNLEHQLERMKILSHRVGKLLMQRIVDTGAPLEILRPEYDLRSNEPPNYGS